MVIATLLPAELRLNIDADALGFADTGELLQSPLHWIGQRRAETAARFGLAMDQPNYGLFVLGEVGSGRASLLQQAMREAAANRAVPPDLCYLHNFDAPERPRALRLPAGQGRQLRQLMAGMSKSLQLEIPQRLGGEDCRAESARIEKAYKLEEDKAYAELDAFAEARHFSLYRESGRLVFTLRDDQGRALTENDAVALPKERRAEIDQSERELRTEISRFLEGTRPMQRIRDDALTSLRRDVVKPLLDRELEKIIAGLKTQPQDPVKLKAYLDQVMLDVLESLPLFQAGDPEDEPARVEDLTTTLARYRVNLVVDNDGMSGAPVVVENNPAYHALFGSIEYQAESDVLMTDFSRIRAGSLLKAHGGFLLLHLSDLLSDELVWAKLRRFLRSFTLQIEETGMASSPMAAVSLQPEAVDLDVKIVLIGSAEQYYALQEGDPDSARRFRVKVDFAESFLASPETYRSSAVFVAHTCAKMGLPQFSSQAAARLLEASHREVDDQRRQSAIFAHMESLVVESASLCRSRGASLVEAQHVDAALLARKLRHDYPEQRLREAIQEGEKLLVMRGARVGQINGLIHVDLGDYRFGFPTRITARTFAGDEGLISIDREVEMSGPIHDKCVLILRSYLSALFAHMAPLALDASIVFEQEYEGVEGDSASCAELYALLSALSGIALQQGIAVTGAINQQGELMPVGGINEKIEGYFRACETAGLDGSQGVLIPERNRRHLMLEAGVVDAAAKGVFHIYTAEHAIEGLALLTGMAAGVADKAGGYAQDSVLGHAQAKLLAYREACRAAENDKPPDHRAHKAPLIRPKGEL